MLTGSLGRVLGADRARRLVVPALSGTESDLYLVELEQPGLTISRSRLLDTSRSAAACLS